MGSRGRVAIRWVCVALLLASAVVGLGRPARSTPGRTYRYVVSGRQHSGDLEERRTRMPARQSYTSLASSAGAVFTFGNAAYMGSAS